MLNDKKITQRLEDMSRIEDQNNKRWPENCAGSRKALVIFVGPSPGVRKEENRREINLKHSKPHWNEVFDAPLVNWSRGFRTSFESIVVNIFNRPYEEAGKLVARVNMDWLSNPKSRDVSYRYMWEGCKYILPVIYECDPVLIIPMDEKTFSILQIALYNDGYKIRPVETGSISIMISGKNQKKRYHRNMMAFGAEKENVSFLVIKSPQHPARIYDNEYAKRVGLSIRMAAKQIWGGDDINLDIE